MAQTVSQPFRVQVVTSVGDRSGWIAGNGSAYKGQQTFTSLAAVVARINSTGGWGQLNGTRLDTVFLSSSELDAIAPPGVLRGVQGCNAVFSNAGGAWNGFGFWLGIAGGHFSHWGNQLYLLRVADPPGVFRLYNPAPIKAVVAQTTGLLVEPSLWSSLTPDGGALSSNPIWGPRAVHTFNAIQWDSARERLYLVGSNQWDITNPTAYGQYPAAETNFWIFSPYAARPQQAWDKKLIQTSMSGYYSMCIHADGKTSFRGLESELRTYDPVTDTISNSRPNGTYGPRQERHFSFGPSLRNGSTYYETAIYPRDTRYGVETMALYRLNDDAVIAVLPSWVNDTPNFDQSCQPVIYNGHAYFWNGTSRVARVNLTTGAIQEFSDGTTIQRPPVTTWTGILGRWAVCSQAQCFVGVSSESTNAYVFRPPAGWGVF